MTVCVRGAQAFAIILAVACSEPPAFNESNGSIVEEGSCGVKGLPDCPLQSWMKATLQSYARSQKYDRIATSFERLSKVAPIGFEEWSKISVQGVKAAQKKNKAGVMASCKSCHDMYRKEFRKSFRYKRIL